MATNVFTLLIKIGLAIFNFFMLYNIQYNSTAHWTNKRHKILF